MAVEVRKSSVSAHWLSATAKPALHAMSRHIERPTRDEVLGARAFGALRKGTGDDSASLGAGRASAPRRSPELCRATTVTLGSTSVPTDGARSHDADTPRMFRPALSQAAAAAGVRPHGHRPAPDHTLVAAADGRSLPVLRLPGAALPPRPGPMSLHAAPQSGHIGREQHLPSSRHALADFVHLPTASSARAPG